MRSCRVAWGIDALLVINVVIGHCHVRRLPVRLPWLAPDITTTIINGRKPPQLTAQTLMRLTPRLPADWAEQRKLLGFH